ncbi:MAG: hypothetical protein ABWX88_06815 [Pseudoxanthomonas sp.]
MAGKTAKKTNGASFEAVTRKTVVRSGRPAIGPKWELVITKPKGGGPGKMPFAEMLRGIREQSALLHDQLRQLTLMEEELKAMKKSAR